MLDMLLSIVDVHSTYVDSLLSFFLFSFLLVLLYSVLLFLGLIRVMVYIQHNVYT